MRFMNAPLLELYRVLSLGEVRMRLMTAPLLEFYKVYEVNDWPASEVVQGFSDSVR